MELSFLTIVVSLAVCSLLIYAVFQYTKVRLNLLEQSQKEQALILQQFIEESSTDISRLYKISANNGRQYEPQGSIILEYANDLTNENNDHEQDSQKQPAYNEPHMIHLDTAIFKNKKSNLIEISSDSEDTTENENDDNSTEGDNETGSDTTSDSGSESNSDSDSDSDSDNDSNSDSESDSMNEKIHPDPNIETLHEAVSNTDTEIHDISCDTAGPGSDIKLVTVDLGTIHEPLSSKTTLSEGHPDLLTMLYKKSQDQTITDEPVSSPAQEHTQVPSTAPATVSYTSMSVTELRHLLKEKYKQHPEKYAEIQKLKKAELVYALQNANV
jgi:hypothetical protein